MRLWRQWRRRRWRRRRPRRRRRRCNDVRPNTTDGGPRTETVCDCCALLTTTTTTTTGGGGGGRRAAAAASVCWHTHTHTYTRAHLCGHGRRRRRRRRWRRVGRAECDETMRCGDVGGGGGGGGVSASSCGVAVAAAAAAVAAVSPHVAGPTNVICRGAPDGRSVGRPPPSVRPVSRVTAASWRRPAPGTVIIIVIVITFFFYHRLRVFVLDVRPSVRPSAAHSCNCLFLRVRVSEPCTIYIMIVQNYIYTSDHCTYRWYRYLCHVHTVEKNSEKCQHSPV